MMKCICHFYYACTRALAEQDKEKDQKVTWEHLKTALKEEMTEINNLKFILPNDDEEDKAVERFDNLCVRIDQKVKKF